MIKETKLLSFHTDKSSITSALDNLCKEIFTSYHFCYDLSLSMEYIRFTSLFLDSTRLSFQSRNLFCNHGSSAFVMLRGGTLFSFSSFYVSNRKISFFDQLLGIKHKCNTLFYCRSEMQKFLTLFPFTAQHCCIHV